MLGGQGQLGAFAAHIEIGVTPTVQFARTPQGLSRAAGLGVFAGVMNHQDGQLELPLELPQIREQRGDLGGVVFIDPMQPDQWVQDQQDGTLLLDGLSQAVTIRLGIQPERGGGNDLHRQRVKRNLGNFSSPSRRFTRKASHKACGRASGSRGGEN